MSHIGWGGEQTTIYKGVETFPKQMRFKALKGSPKGKTQRGQYLLAVDLGRYKWYQSQTPNDVPAFSLFPKGGRHEAVCQYGPQRGWIWGQSHIDWRKERVSVKTLAPKGGGL